MKLPAEVLTKAEVEALMNAIPTHSVPGKRLRAIIGLMYRAEVKVGQLSALAFRHYDSTAGALTIPGTQGGPDRVVRLDSVGRQLLGDWLEARKTLNVTKVAPLFCTIQQPRRGAPLSGSAIRTMIKEAGADAGIERRVTPQGLKKSRAHHRDSESGRFEATIIEYVSDESFRGRYPGPHQKWSDAHAILETAPDRLGSTVGHLCREAIQQFSDELVARHGLGPFEANKTKAKIRAVFEADAGVSPTVKRSLEALVAYWETVSDLVQRQEHGSALGEEDGRRLVFQTMLVMREIDIALKRAPSKRARVVR
jgi:hypothetical protein